MPCDGNSKPHCCRIRGEDCPFIIRNYVDENGHRRKIACGLRAEHGNWDAVLADPRYPANSWAKGVNCRDWPEVGGNGCSVCGAGR